MRRSSGRAIKCMAIDSTEKRSPVPGAAETNVKQGMAAFSAGSYPSNEGDPQE